MLDETMKAWIYQLNGEEREQIVDTVFGMLEAADIKTVDDFYHKMCIRDSLYTRDACLKM